MITRDTIKAIPTKYQGVQFKSKMEARFAKWCDNYHQEWIYEPEGFTNGKICYCPDFLLPKSKMIVEIKPEIFLSETYKLDMMLKDKAFDKYAFAVISVNKRDKRIEVLKYQGPGEYVDDDRELTGKGPRIWAEKYQVNGFGFCNNCSSFNIYVDHFSWKCSGCGFGSYNGDRAMEYF